nr:hypothetical protein [Tanacetum cinerariifolium]
MMKHEKGTDEEADSFDDQLDTPDEEEDSNDDKVESTDKEEDTSDEDYELELKKKSNSKGSKAKSDKSKFKIISYKKFGTRTVAKGSKSKGKRRVEEHLAEIQAYDHDLLVNSDNENDDMLGYESKKYYDVKDAAGTNHLD